MSCKHDYKFKGFVSKFTKQKNLIEKMKMRCVFCGKTKLVSKHGYKQH